jgi:hypothetical protein
MIAKHLDPFSETRKAKTQEVKNQKKVGCSFDSKCMVPFFLKAKNETEG